MRAPISADPLDPSELVAPSGLRCASLQVGAERYLLLSHPVTHWELPDVLTGAEREIARAVLSGASRRAIARARGTSVCTVSNLLAQVFRKLGVSSRIELAAQLSARPSAPEASP